MENNTDRVETRKIFKKKIVDVRNKSIATIFEKEQLIH